MFYFFRLEAWKFEKEMSLETCAAFKQKYSNAGRTKNSIILFVGFLKIVSSGFSKFLFFPSFNH